MSRGNFVSRAGHPIQVAAQAIDRLARAAALKAKYDPTNLFRVNQNIRPAAQES